MHDFFMLKNTDEDLPVVAVNKMINKVVEFFSITIGTGNDKIKTVEQLHKSLTLPNLKKN